MLSLIADILCGFTWWNLGTQLADVIFFFPLFKMAISGYEAFVFISPLVMIFMGYQRFKNFVGRHPVFFHLLSLAGYYSFWTDPATKIGILAVTESFACLSLFSRLLSPSAERRHRAVYGTLLGLLIMVIARMAYHSLNPFWVYLPGLYLAVALGVLGGLLSLLTFRPHSPADASPELHSPALQSNWLVVALGFGTLLFHSRWFGTEHGVVARWTSVQPFPSGVLLVLAMVAGIFLNDSPLPGATLWWAVGMLASVCFYYGSTYYGYAAGLLLVVFGFSLWQRYFDALQQLQSLAGRCITIGMASQLLWIVGTVWVVAYNFVPLGNLSRENVHILLFASTFLLGFTFFYIPQLRRPTPQKDERPSVVVSSTSWLPQIPGVVFLALVLIFCFLAPVAYFRTTELLEPAPPSKQPAGTFTGMIWTVHFGYDNVGENNFKQVLDLINREGRPELIGLLETDISRVFTGNRDLVEYLAAHLHYYSDYGPETRENTWGCAFLSLYPIVRANHILLPSITGELACAVDATVDIDGSFVDVIVTHFGNFEDPLDRKLQSEYVRDLVASKPEGRPVVYLGYLVSEPWGENFKIITSSGFQDTAPHYYDRWCEYIFYKNLKFHKFHNRSVGKISDTEFQWARFSLLNNK